MPVARVRQWTTSSLPTTSFGADLTQAADDESLFHASWTGKQDFSGGPVLSITSRTTPNSGAAVVDGDNGRFHAPDDANAVTSSIHHEARIENWQVVLSLCNSQPHHAQYADQNGWTALHHACNRRCPRSDVVKALIIAYPGALLDLEEKGMTPLHYACRFKAPVKAVRHLLHLFPEKGHAAVSRRDRQGRTPLFYAVRYEAPPGVVELLLEVDPGAVLNEDRNAGSPLAVIWDDWAEKFEGKRTLQPYLHPDEAGLQDSTPAGLRAKLEADLKLKKRWSNVNMLLRAAFRFPMETPSTKSIENRQWRVLHATAAIKCHHTLFLLARALYPEQAMEFDEGDLSVNHTIPRSALHLAASSPANGDSGKSVLASLTELNPEAAFMVDEEDGTLPFHLIVDNKWKSHWSMDGLRSLLSSNPLAARAVDKQGRMPLHRAAAAIANHAGTDWSGATSSLDIQSTIYNLLQVYREAARVPDITGCLPLHLIASQGRIWDEEVDAVYNAHEAATRTRAGPQADFCLPLHLAANNKRAELSLVAKLVELNPRAASQTEANGKLPLHLACEIGNTWDKGISNIYDAFPNAVREREANGRSWTALQMASASRNETGPLIEKLVELNQGAANQQDTKKRFALHLACVAGKGWETGLRTLFEANPDALFIEDECGLLPFHIAAFRYCKPSEIEIERANNLKGPVFKSRVIVRTNIVEIPSPRSCENEAVQIEIMFELLRAAPNVLLI
jgi:hypothetical protein